MAEHHGSYGSNPNPNADSTFKPGGEPDKRDNRGSIEHSGVPATPPVVAYEPDQDAGAHPFVPGDVTTVRRATNEKAQDISDPGVGVEPGV